MHALEVVARHGSFTRAAEELHMAQPTVSLHVKKLTETVGVPLLECSGKRVLPTAAGRALGLACEEILGAFVRFDEALADLRGMRSGTLSLAIGTAEKYLVPPLLAEFVRAHPGIAPTVQMLPRAALLARFAAAADDVYLMPDPPACAERMAQPLLAHPFVVFARRDHSLAAVKSIPFTRFAEEPLLLREPGSATRAVADRVFAERRLAPKVRMELGSNETIREAMLSGLGVAILGRYSIGLEPPALAVLDVTGFPVPMQSFFVHPAHRRPSAAARGFVEIATRSIANIAASGHGWAALGSGDAVAEPLAE
jgi:DNA-binding transcriptional LysR family regulator